MKKELHAALSLVADHLPASLVFYTRAPLGDRRFTWVAGDVEGVLGHSAPDLTADPDLWGSILHPADRERVASTLSQVSGDASEDAVELRYRIETRDGQERWIQDDLCVLRSREGAPTELLGVLSDVTARYVLEKRVASLEERLWESQRMESLGFLAGGIAHDFNNLLTAILSSAQLLEEDAPLGDEARDDLDVIRRSARKGAAMVRQILDFSRRSSHSRSDLDVGEVVDDLRSILDRTLGADVELEVEIGDDLPAVHAAAARLEQVVLNLAMNAREAMPEGGTLRIQAARERLDRRIPVASGTLPGGTYVRVTVEDDGPGIPEDLRERIFEPFFSTKRQSDQGTGSGVGLATVQRVVRGYGGGVRVESEEGRGTAFHVYLPTAARGTRRPPEVLVAEAQTSGGEGARILVVEDDPQVRDVVQRTLSAAGYTVSAVGSAEEGLKVFDRVRPPFDLLVADVVLPDRPGPQLHRALTRRVPDLPVLYMSGYGEEMVTRRGGNDPGVHFLAKPFSPDKLRATIRQILLERGIGRTGEPGDRESGNTGA